MILPLSSSFAVTNTVASSLEEVECSACSLDPICYVLDYAVRGSDVPGGGLSRREWVPSGGTLFSPTDQFHSIYAVKSGSFKAVVQDTKGRERVLGFYFPGELIGADAMSSRRYSTTVRALEPSQVCELRIHQLPESGRPTEVIQRAIIEMLCKEMELNQLITSSLINQNSEQRLAAFLITVSKRLESRGLPKDHFSLHMSRSDIASYLGLARETVSRLLTRFQCEGLIGLRRRRLELLKRDRLEEMSFSI